MTKIQKKVTTNYGSYKIPEVCGVRVGNNSIEIRLTFKFVVDCVVLVISVVWFIWVV